MKKKNPAEALAKTLDSMDIIEKPEVIVPISNDKQEDYEFSRNYYKKLVLQSTDAIDRMIQLAQEIDDPRTFIALSEMITNSAAVVDKVMDLQQKKQKLDEKIEDKPQVQSITQNNTFVGSPAELQKMLIDKKKAEALPI